AEEYELVLAEEIDVSVAVDIAANVERARRGSRWVVVWKDLNQVGGVAAFELANYAVRKQYAVEVGGFPSAVAEIPTELPILEQIRATVRIVVDDGRRVMLEGRCSQAGQDCSSNRAGNEASSSGIEPDRNVAVGTVLRFPEISEPIAVEVTE